MSDSTSAQKPLLGDEIVAKGYKFPKTSFRTEDTYHIWCSVGERKALERAMSLTVHRKENGSYTMDYTNSGHTWETGTWSVAFYSENSSEQTTNEITEYILSKLEAYKASDASKRTIDPAVMDYILSK